MVRVITVKPKDMSDETIKARLDGLKQKIKDNESEIKELEDELERRRQEVPLGVPIELTEGIEKSFYLQPALSVSCGNVGAGSMLDKALGVFHSKESAEKHAEMLLAWRMALVALSKNEPIDITVLLPLLKKGWVAMDKDGRWFWFKKEPVTLRECWTVNDWDFYKMPMFNIKPAENWEDSLMECGL